MFICPTCGRGFVAEEGLVKHFLQCWHLIKNVKFVLNLECIFLNFSVLKSSPFQFHRIFYQQTGKHSIDF